MHHIQQETAELSLPRPSTQHDTNQMNEILTDTAPASRPGDLEQGLLANADTEAEASNKSEDEAVEEVARESCQSGPFVYVVDLVRLAIFYWAIVSDALFMKELYSQQYMVFAGTSTGFTVGPHVFMSLLLIIRQGWLQAASQACGFILTLNPFESLTPIPQGILGLFVISIGFIAYVLIAASGLIFVAYCVICYLVTALLFSLLILDLAALVITVAPRKGLFKYTDLVYTENFKFSRLVLQSWLQSAPELVMICIISYRNWSKQGPAVVINSPILLQACMAHLINLWDKTCMFHSAAAFAGASYRHHLLSMLQVKGSCRLSLPVLKENLNRVLRGAGGAAGTAAGLGSVIHISSAEEAPDNDSEAAASMVPEYLTPTNGGLLSPGQLMALVRVVLRRYGGPGVAELVLEVTPDVMIGVLLSELAGSIPNTSSVRLVNASVRGSDASMLATALLQCGSLRALQLHQVIVDERGAAALAQLLEHTPTLQQLDLCRCKLRCNAPQALAQGLRCNKTLRHLNLAGAKGLDDAGASNLAAALACSKVLCALSLAFVKLGNGAVDSLVQAINSSSSLRVLAVSQDDLPPEGGKKLVAAISGLCHAKAAPSLTCNVTLGTFPVEGLEKVQWLAVRDQDALIMDAWQGLVGSSSEGCEQLQAPRAAGGSGSHCYGLGDSRGGCGAGHISGGVVVGVDESTPLLSPAAGATGPSSSNSRLQGVMLPPASAFAVASPVPPGFASASTTMASTAAAAAAWFNSGSTGVVTYGTPGGTGCSHSNASSSNSSSCSSTAAFGTISSRTDVNCPSLVFVMTQDEVVNCMVHAPLLFNEIDTLNLTGLGVENQGAKAMAQVLEDNPSVRRVILADNKIGEEGGASLAAAITLNHTLQVLDLSDNELSETGVAILADATRQAAGLRQLRLLGNKIPFGLSTLKRLVQIEKSAPHCHLILVEDPSEVLDDLTRSGDARQAAQAAEFFKRQEQYRTARRQRIAAWQQKVERLEEQAIAAAAAVDGQLQRACAAGSSGVSTAPSNTADIEGPAPVTADIEAPAPVVTTSGTTGQPSPDAAGTGSTTTTALAGSSSSSSSNNDSSAAVPRQFVRSGSEVFWPASPQAGGSVSSITAEEDTCGVCFDNNNHVAIKYCGHRLCVDCYRKVWELRGTVATCPFCRARLQGYLYLDWPLEL